MLIIWKSIKSKQGVLHWMINQFRLLPIPKGTKWAILIVFFGNFLSIAIGKPNYPFYDVGMFRWSSNFSNPEKIVYRPKYYYKKNGEVKILDLRKEGFFFLAEHWGWGTTHEFTFSANYHNKGQKENFEYIQNKAKEIGIDTLWVGVHAVNYETQEVWFDSDICKAIQINKMESIHYGAIYIPEYQILACNEN
ncbi:MAG: hypothetical protein HWE07_06310 [Cytophagia bacterium]|nr:hypothetical protein [Cytophagia bacterium]